MTGFHVYATTHVRPSRAARAARGSFGCTGFAKKGGRTAHAARHPSCGPDQLFVTVQL